MTEGMRADGMGSTEAARGSELEGLAALQNFENLLRSPRVASRSLGQLVTEVQASCDPIRTAFEALLSELGRREPDAPVLGELRSEADARLQQLDEALGCAAGAPMSTRSRLGLELQVREVAAELGRLRSMLDLLTHATAPRCTELDALDVTMAAVHSMGASRSDARVDVAVLSPKVRAVVSTDPHVAIPLITLAIGSLANQGVRRVSVELTRSAGSTLLTVVPCGRIAHAVACAPPDVAGAALETARLAARCVGGSFEPEDERCVVRLPAFAAPAASTHFAGEA